MVISPSRPRLSVLVVCVGAVGGLVGALYVLALKGLERLLWPTHYSIAAHFGILCAVGLAAGLLTCILGTPGDVELLVDNIHVLGGAKDVSDLRSLIPVSLLCIASGGGMGPEAPMVQTTGSIGSWLAKRWRVSVDDTRVLTITGMAAGFTVLFGAPLGSAVFALEILHRRGLQYYEAVLPAVLGSLSGYVVYLAVAAAGVQPVWRFPAPGHLHRVDLAWGVACGVGGAVIAIVFTYVAHALRWIFRHLGPTLRPLSGAIVLGALAWWSPYALTYGEAQIKAVVLTHATIRASTSALLAKLCGTTVTLAAGWRGGFIIPLFFMGVAAGRFGHALFPHTNEVVLMASLMAAANCGVTKTPIGSTLVVTEMAGLSLLTPVLIAALLALFLTSGVGLIATQREREGSGPAPATSTDGRGDAGDGHRGDARAGPGDEAPRPPHREET